MSCLTVIQRACSRIGIAAPIAAVSSTDVKVQQLLALSNEEGEELSASYPWQALRNEATFTTVATESQGLITAIAGAGFRYIINNTIWNRSLRRPVFGPLTPPQWQQLKAQSMQGPFNQFVIRGNAVLFTPAPAAGNSCYFEWMSRAWCASSDGSTSSSFWVADTDVALLDEDIMVMGLIWRWKAAKGLDYAEDFNKYERRKTDAQARDGGKPTLDLNGTDMDIFPGVIVPAGFWGV